MKRQTAAERAAWLKRRDRGIGGSDAPIVMDTSPWCTPFELWARKTGRLRPQPKTAAMERGLELEPIARRAYEKETGIPMPPDEFDFPLGRPELTFIRANLDGINRDAKKVLEIKCPGMDDHLVAARDKKIPDKYLWQCVHLMLVADLPALDYWSFDGWQGVVVTMERDLKLERLLIERETEFWQHVTEDTPPAFDLFPTRRKK